MTLGTWQRAVVTLLPLPELLSSVMTGVSALISITNHIHEHVFSFFPEKKECVAVLPTCWPPPVTSESIDQFQSHLPEVWVAHGLRVHHLLQLPLVVGLFGEGSGSVPRDGNGQRCACKSQS